MAVSSFMTCFGFLASKWINRQNAQLFLSFLLCFSLFACAHAGELPETAVLKIGSQSYQMEVANTEAKSFRGLMYRTSLPTRAGMAFPFAQQKVAVFWMKNTLVPLDMVFVRGERIVRVLQNVPPCPKEKGDNCPLYSSIVPIDWVYELPGGTAKTDKIKVHHKAKLKFSPLDQ